MLVSAQQVVTRALRIARIIGQDETPSSADLSVGLDVLTTMLASWANDSAFVPADCGTFSVPTWATLAVTNTVDDALLHAIYYNLAILLAPEFGGIADDDVRREARRAKKSWTRKIPALTIGRLEFELSSMPFRSGSVDLLNSIDTPYLSILIDGVYVRVTSLRFDTATTGELNGDPITFTSWAINGSLLTINGLEIGT